MSKKRIGLIFGGASTEHEISIITFHQVYKAMDKNIYEPVPIYITPQGDWICDHRLNDMNKFSEIFSGNRKGLEKFNRKFIAPYPSHHDASAGFLSKLSNSKIDIDVAFPLIHGYGGEDGSLQGLLELADIPYVGATVAGSAVGIDKVFQKRILSAAGLPVVDYLHFLKTRVEDDHDAVKQEILSALTFPIFVKPASAGSSVGISKVDSAEQLSMAMDDACRYDRKIIVEQGVKNPREINCALFGDDETVTTSVCEEVFSTGFLDYEQKYMKGGKKAKGGMANVARNVPADIPPEIEAEIKKVAVATYRELDISGCCRVDFLLSEENQLTVTELNSIPGSLSFYLWEASGTEFPKLLEQLINIAVKNHRRKKMLRRVSGFGVVEQYLKNSE